MVAFHPWSGDFSSHGLVIWRLLLHWQSWLQCMASTLINNVTTDLSRAPVSGGQYHFVALLAPAQHRVFLSWITGWIATIGWNANTAAGIFFSGTLIQGILTLNDSSYDYQRWHGTLIMWAALSVVILVNTVAARHLPKIEGLILVLHTLGFLAILIPMVYLSDHNSARTVFADFSNNAGWKSDGLAFFVGLISNTLPFIGYDGPSHMGKSQFIYQDACIN